MKHKEVLRRDRGVSVKRGVGVGVGVIFFFFFFPFFFLSFLTKKKKKQLSIKSILMSAMRFQSSRRKFPSLLTV